MFDTAWDRTKTHWSMFGETWELGQGLGQDGTKKAFFRTRMRQLKKLSVYPHLVQHLEATCPAQS